MIIHCKHIRLILISGAKTIFLERQTLYGSIILSQVTTIAYRYTGSIKRAGGTGTIAIESANVPHNNGVFITNLN